VKTLRFLAAICVSMIASASINQPAFGREIPSVVRDVCKIFPPTHLTECGGKALSSTIGAQWNSGSPALGMAAFNSTVVSNFENLKFTQEQFATNWTEAGASLEEPVIIAAGCGQVRLVIATGDGFVEAHGTGICHGFAVNFFVSGTQFTDLIVSSFKEAMAALARDKRNHP
jgi:hypothetical protein